MMHRTLSFGSNCYTCLCGNRDLRPLGVFPGFLAYCEGLDLKATDRICWECSAALKKYHQFRIRTLSVQKIYKNLQSSVFLDHYPGGPYKIQKLSNLTKVTTNTYDKVFVSVAQSVEQHELRREQIFLNPASIQQEPDNEPYSTIKEEQMDNDYAINQDQLEDDVDVKSEDIDIDESEPYIPYIPYETPQHSQVVSADKTPQLVKQIVTSTDTGASKKVVRSKRRVKSRLTRRKRRKESVPEKEPIKETTESTIKGKRSPCDSDTDSAPETEQLASAAASAAGSAAASAAVSGVDEVRTRTLTYEQACEFRRRRRSTFAAKGFCDCVRCAVAFHSIGKHAAHMKLHSPAPSSLSEHLNMHRGVRPLKCEHCPATFVYSTARNTHTRLVHKPHQRARRGGRVTPLKKVGLGRPPEINEREGGIETRATRQRRGRLL